MLFPRHKKRGFFWWEKMMEQAEDRAKMEIDREVEGRAEKI